MRLVTFQCGEESPRVGAQVGERVLDLRAAREALEAPLPAPTLDSLQALLEAGPRSLERVRDLIARALDRRLEAPVFHATSEVRLLSPLPRPTGLRDFYAFEAHVKRARERRGLGIPPEWYQFPVFYFSNHLAVVGPETPVRRPMASQCLDYELEVACVIGREGRDIPEEEAEDYIAGYMVFNDWSARDLQREEMKIGLGPAKGKDFASSLGPALVTPDELVDRRLEDGRYDLTMVGRVNGREYSRGNLREIYWTFPQLIVRASQDCTLYPGEVLGSGCVGSGSILELGAETYGWLKPGDRVELEVERLGILRNYIVG